MKIDVIKHQFVEFMPETLADGVVYVSISFTTAVHKCCCGCGNHVVTPLSPTDWSLRFNGVSISLTPSIGNWSFPCRSHYWIKENRVVWDREWDQEKVDDARAIQTQEKEDYYNRPNAPSNSTKRDPSKGKVTKKSLKQRFKKWLKGRQE